MTPDLIARLRNTRLLSQRNQLALQAEAADALETLMTQVMALEDRAERSERRYRHTRQWYAERWERITAYAKEHGFWDDIACIMANGTLNVREGRAYDPPTYAQQLNVAIHRAEAAEDRASKLRGHAEAMAKVMARIGRAEPCHCARCTAMGEDARQSLAAYRSAFPEVGR